MSRRFFLALIVPCAAIDCATPTSVAVEVVSEVPCDRGAQVLLIGGSTLNDLPNRAPSAQATICEPDGSGGYRRGEIVLAPAGAKDAPLAFELVTRDDAEPPESLCTAGKDASRCIRARRELRFSSHTEQRLRVDLRLSCLGIVCDPSTTCVRGRCVDAHVGGVCNSSPCDEGKLTGSDAADASAPDGASDAPAGLSDASIGAPTVLGTGVFASVARLGSGFVVAWVSKEPGSSYAIRVRRFDNDGRPVAEGGPYPSTANGYVTVGTDGTRVALVDGDTVTPGVRFRYVDMNGGSPGTSLVLSQASVGNVHGVPWAGQRFGQSFVGSNGEIYLTTLDSTPTQGPNTLVATSGTWNSTSAMASTFGLTWRSFARACYLATLDAEGALLTGPTTLASACFNPHLAPSNDSWKIVYYNSESPYTVNYLKVQPSGAIVTGPVVVSPPGGDYQGPQIAPFASGNALVAFLERGTTEMHTALIDDAGKVLRAGTRLFTGAVTRFELAQAPDRAALVTVGGSAADAVTFQVLAER